jgi:hypothetical protein
MSAAIAGAARTPSAMPARSIFFKVSPHHPRSLVPEFCTRLRRTSLLQADHSRHYCDIAARENLLI